MRKNIWTVNEVEFLIKNYNNTTNKELGVILKKTSECVRGKARRLKLFKSDNHIIDKRFNACRTWTVDDENFLIKNYKVLNNKEISIKLNKPITSIRTKSIRMGLKKEDIWSDSDLKFLIDNYSENFNYDLEKILNKNVSAINNKAHKLNLYKSKEQKSKHISKRNKMVGRDLNCNLLTEIAKKYKSRGEFQKKDSSAYSSARTKNILDDICEHMIPQSFSVPQLILKDIIEQLIDTDIKYNTRKIIKPYELDIYLPEFNIAFEYNGKGWHKNNKNDVIKIEKCLNKNIKLFTFLENNRNYENDIKEQFIKILKDFNDICNTKVTEDDIKIINVNNVYKYIYNIDDLLSISKKYTLFKEFKEKESVVYRKLCKLKLLDTATIHMSGRRKRKNITEIKEKVKNFEYLLDLIKYDNSTYNYIAKHKLWDLISELKRKKRYSN